MRSRPDPSRHWPLRPWAITINLAALYEAVAPLGRNITRDEVGASGMFLLSDLASGITGEIMHVDCGYNVMGSPGRAIEAVKAGNL